jgi:hypothetical protein
MFSFRFLDAFSQLEMISPIVYPPRGFSFKAFWLLGTCQELFSLAAAT